MVKIESKDPITTAVKSQGQDDPNLKIGKESDSSKSLLPNSRLKKGECKMHQEKA